VMCLSVDGKKINALFFLKKRFFRIVPLYWLLTSVAFFIYVINPSLVNSSGGETSPLASYFLYPTEDKLLINNGWTLSFEFYFYFLLAFFLFFNFSLFSLAVFIFMLSLFGFFLDFKLFLLDFFTSFFLLEFLYGMIAFWLFKKGVVTLFFGFFALFFGGAFLIFINFNSDLMAQYGNRAFYAGGAMLLVFLGLVSVENIIPKSKFLSLLGDASFSLYLLHPFVLAGVNFIFYHFVFENEVFMFFSMFFLSLILSIICYKFLEVKMISYFKRF